VFAFRRGARGSTRDAAAAKVVCKRGRARRSTSSAPPHGSTHAAAAAKVDDAERKISARARRAIAEAVTESKSGTLAIRIRGEEFQFLWSHEYNHIKEHTLQLLRLRLLILCAAAVALAAQESMNNDGIVRLMKSGMSEDLIINVVQQQPGTYSLGADDLIALKAAGVSERLISAMLAKGKGETPGSTPAGAAKPGGGPSPRTSVTGPGLYYKKGSDYFELLTEDVDWKTSGAMKSFVSAGIVKKNLDGNLAGASSRNFLNYPVEIVLSPPSGLTVNSYILLPMKPGKGIREFSVGPVNQKSGVARGAIAFGVEKVGDNLFRMVLATPLPPSEYGILAATPPASGESSKMYTFRVLLGADGAGHDR
jgi:hypothetical protein